MPEDVVAREGRKARRSPILDTIRALVRTRITAGLLTILPLILTVWLLKLVFLWLRYASLWAIEAFLLSAPGEPILKNWNVTSEELTAKGIDALPLTVQWGISIFAVLLTFFLLYVVGLFTANVIGRRLLEFMDLIVDRLPLVKTIYRTLKQLIGLFSGEQSHGFKRVALVPFPNELTRSVAFVTNTMRDSVTGEELCACFIATTPNPTTGFVFVLRRADIVEVDWSVEDAVKIVMSGGILAPPSVSMVVGRPPQSTTTDTGLRPGR
jgi:uncharacterized membrane protein